MKNSYKIGKKREKNRGLLVMMFGGFRVQCSVAVAQLAASRLTEMVAFCWFWLVMAWEPIKSGLARLSQCFELVIGYL